MFPMKCIYRSICMICFGLAIAGTVRAEKNFHNYAYGECLVDAAEHFQINPELIDAIIKTESNHDPRAVHINTSGSEDIGLMQVNAAIWLPHIKAQGYDRNSLFDPCNNIIVGSWILAQEIQRFGYTWSAVGAYNAGPAKENISRRSSYAQRVFGHLNQ